MAALLGSLKKGLTLTRRDRAKSVDASKSVQESPQSAKTSRPATLDIPPLSTSLPLNQQSVSSISSVPASSATSATTQNAKQADPGKKLLEYCQDGILESARKYALSHPVADAILSTINSPLDMYGNTPIHVASSFNDVKLVSLLLSKGADPRLPNRAGATALSIAHCLGFVELKQAIDKASSVSSPVTEINPAELCSRDRSGCTTLMKAAYKGDNGLVSQILERYPRELEVTDSAGHTALTWACLAGRLSTVKLLIERYHARVDGAMPANICPWSEAFMPTPLIVASFAGHVTVVEVLIANGCEIDKRVGGTNSPGNRGCTAVMVAAWMRREQVVRCLLESGCQVDGDIDRWLTKGMVRLKKMSVDHWGWAYTASEKSSSSAIGKSDDVVSQSIHLLSSEDSETVASMRSLLTSKSFEMRLHASSATLSGSSDNGSTLGKSDYSYVSESTTSLSASASSLTPISGSVPRTRALNRRSQMRSNRQGLNLDKLTGNNPDMFIDLTMKLPERGTDLDHQLSNVFTCVLQLVMAANKNVKPHYVIIAAKAINHSRALMRSIETMDRSVGSTKDAVTPISPHYLHSSSNRLTEGSLFSGSIVMNRIKEKLKILGGECHDELTLATKLACGIWPPPSAVADMIRASAMLSKTSRELVELANLLGFFPIVDRPLEIQNEPFQSTDLNEVDDIGAEEEGDELPATFTPTGPMLNDYEDYKRQNDLRVMTELSRSFEKNLDKYSESEPNSVSSNGTLIQNEKSPSEQSVAQEEIPVSENFEKNLKTFVQSVTALKRIANPLNRKQYMTAVTDISNNVQTLLVDFNSNHLLDVLAEAMETTITLSLDDISKLESTGISLDSILETPAPVAHVLRVTKAELLQAVRTMTELAKVASGRFPPETLEQDLLSSCYPCVLAVKTVATVTKDALRRCQEVWKEEQRKRNDIGRRIGVGVKVNAMIQVLENSADADNSNSSSLSLDDLTKLNLVETAEGLTLDPATKIVRGGKLAKLVEVMTSFSHGDVDEDFMAAFILTHHSFTTSIRLLGTLVKRYEKFCPPPDLSERLYRAWVERRVKRTQMNVLTVLKYWVKTYYEEDFCQNSVLLRNIKEFVDKEASADYEHTARELLDVLNFHSTKSRRHTSFLPSASPSPSIDFSSAATSMPKSIIPKQFYGSTSDIYSYLASDISHIFDIDNLELARQLTLIEFDDFKRVKAHECLSQIWASRMNKEREAVKPKSASGSLGPGAELSEATNGITKMINHTNHLTLWVATTIMSCENLRSRSTALKYFAHTALRCRELNNFNGITGIVAGLSMAPISRLRKTWADFKERWPRISDEYEEVAAVVSPKGQYANYRKELRDLRPPAIPFLGVYLTDLTFIELGNSDYLSENERHINFEKRRKVYGVIKEIQRFQVTQYNLAAVDGLRQYLLKLGVKDATAALLAPPVDTEGGSTVHGLMLMTEDELYERSLALEPRVEDDE